MSDTLMISVSGMRGHVGSDLTPELVARHAAALGAWVAPHGRAAAAPRRRSDAMPDRGPMFQRAVVAASSRSAWTSSTSADDDARLSSWRWSTITPRGGLMISASHNPIEWNALKFIGPTGCFSTPRRASGDARADRARAASGDVGRLGEPREDPGPSAPPRRGARAAVSGRRGHPRPPLPRGARLRARRRRGHHAAAAGATRLRRHGDQHGAGRPLPRAPEPVPRTWASSERLVARAAPTSASRSTRTSIVSRLSDEAGRRSARTTRWRSRRAPCWSRSIRKAPSSPTSPRAGWSRTWRATRRRAGAGAGRRGERRPGPCAIEGAVIGGEGNGGVILPELHLGRDAPVGVALILQLLATSGGTTAVGWSSRPAALRHRQGQARSADASLDTGVRGRCGRRSRTPRRTRRTGCGSPGRTGGCTCGRRGTEPIVRVIAEAPTAAEAEALVVQSREPLDALVSEVSTQARCAESSDTSAHGQATPSAASTG